MAPKVFGVSTSLAFFFLLKADHGFGVAFASSQTCEEDAASALLQTRVKSQQQQWQQRRQQQQLHLQQNQQHLQKLVAQIKRSLHRGTMSDSERAMLESLRKASSNKESALPNKPTSDAMLWGGPSVAYSEEGYILKNFSLEEVTDMMGCPGPESGLPEDFQGCWWMDQFGVSSVAKDPNYPYAMVGLGETLMSFASGVWEADSKCVTPVTLYHGRDWAFYNDGGGMDTFRAHNSTHNTLSCCYLDDNVTVQLRTKQLKSTAALGPYSLGAWLAELLNFTDAGHGYVWEPAWLMDMTMVKKAWGWDRVTKMVSVTGGPDDSPLVKLLTFLAESLLPVSHYPTLQIIDAQGQKTKYYYEIEALLKTGSLPPSAPYFIPHADGR